MKKQVLNQLESLIKKFNAKNIELFGDEYVYEMQKPNQYKRGHYAVIIEYKKMVSSVDMRDIMKFVIDNNLLLRLGTYRCGQAYMDIQ